jgi:excisionase family DNA binding protein
MNTENEVAATMSVTQAAKLLGIGRQTAYDLAAQGKLPGARRLGRRIIVSKRALERFLDGDSDVVTEGGNDIG